MGTQTGVAGINGKARDGLLSRAMNVLRVISTFPQGVGLSELTRLSRVPKATCFRIVTTLEEEGVVITDEETKRIRVSVGSLSIIGGLLTQGGTLRGIREILEDLSQKTGETTGFDMIQDHNIIVLLQNVGPSIIGQTLSSTPRIQAPWRTSTGKSLLSYLEPQEIRELLTPHYPSENLQQLDTFIDTLEPARIHGYAWMYGGLERDAASVAAPVFTSERPKYAIWIGGPTYRITPDNVRQLGQLAIESATQASRLLNSMQDLHPSFSADSLFSK